MISPARLRRLQGWLAQGGARLRQERYERPGGETSAYRWTPPGTARGRVLLAHGAGNDALYPLLALCRALVAAGWEIFAFDLDGHGRDSSSVYTPAGVRGALAAARAAAGTDLPVHLLGHSLGGSLVLDALASPALADARGAVLLSAPLRVRLGARAALSELRGFLRPATLSQREHYGVWGLVPAAGPLRRGAYPFRMDPALRGPGAFGYVQAVHALLEELRLEEAAGRVRAPVLLVYGARDALVPVDQGRRLADLLPRAELLELPGASHWSVPWDARTVQAVADWLDRHP